MQKAKEICNDQAEEKVERMEKEKQGRRNARRRGDQVLDALVTASKLYEVLSRQILTTQTLRNKVERDSSTGISEKHG